MVFLVPGILLAASSCLQTTELTACVTNSECPESFPHCKAGLCFHFVPEWNTPPCSSPARAPDKACCDLSSVDMDTDAPVCTDTVLSGTGYAAPARGLDGKIYVRRTVNAQVGIEIAATDGTLLSQLPCSKANSDVHGPAVANDGQVALRVGDVICLWDQNGERNETINGAAGSVGPLSVCSEGRVVTATEEFGVIHLLRLDADTGLRWNVSTGKTSNAAKLTGPAVSLSADAVFIAFDDGVVQAREFSSGKLRWEVNLKELDSGIAGMALDGQETVFVSTLAGDVIGLDPWLGGAGDAFFISHIADERLTPPLVASHGVAMVAEVGGKIWEVDKLHAMAPTLYLNSQVDDVAWLKLLAGDGAELAGTCGEDLFELLFCRQRFLFRTSLRNGGRTPLLRPGRARRGGSSFGGRPDARANHGRPDGLLCSRPARGKSSWPGRAGGSGNNHCVEE